MAPQSNTTIQEEPHLDRFPRLRVYGDSVIRLSSIGSLLGVVAGPLKVLLDQDRKEITVDDITGTAAVGALVSLAACTALESVNFFTQSENEVKARLFKIWHDEEGDRSRTFSTVGACIGGGAAAYRGRTESPMQVLGHVALGSAVGLVLHKMTSQGERNPSQRPSQYVENKVDAAKDYAKDRFGNERSAYARTSGSPVN